MKLTFSYVLVVIVLAFSCNKDHTKAPECVPILVENHSYDTILSSDYIMAYPGSWWQYNDGSIDSCTAWEAVPIRNKIMTNDDCFFIEEDMWILPKGNGLIYFGHTAYNRTIFNWPDSNSTRKIPIYDTIPGVFYQESYDSGSGEYEPTVYLIYETLETLDSMMVQGNIYYNIVHVRSITEYDYDGYAGPIYTIDSWLSKNVGVIKWIRKLNGTTTHDRELVDHYIAPH